MRPPLYVFVHMLYWASILSPHSAKSVLEKVFHSDLFSAHSLSDVSAVVHSHHLRVLQADQHITVIGCGPSQSFTAKQDALLGAAKFVDIAAVRHEDNETCLIAHLPSSEVAKFEDSDWTFSSLPSVLKIHQSVIKHLSRRVDIDSPRNSESLEPKNDEFFRMTGHAAVDVETPESRALVVQFVPGVVDSTEETVSCVLASWKVGTVSERQSSSEDGVWMGLRSTTRFRRLSDEDHSGGCEIPNSTIFEYEDTVARLVDLSGWGTLGNSIECLLLLVDAFASHPAVLTVSVQGRPVLLNYDARGVTQSGTSQFTPFSDAGLYGQGQIVGVADSGLDDYSCFFWDNSGYYGSSSTTRSQYNSFSVEEHRRKVVQYIAYGDGYDGEAGHGTHVVGTICGDSIFGGFSKANGVAPGAKVAFYDVMGGSSAYLSIPDLYSYLFPSLYKAGARIMSNSWGSFSGESEYTERSYDADNFAYNYPDTLIIFAAGNSGSQGTKTTYSPCTSKNVLCVGSVDLRNDDDDDVVASGHSRVSYFSSMGPSFDGRIKPEIVSTGNKIVSAMSAGSSAEAKSCGVYETFGTSMAAPTVAGNAILLREYFRNMYQDVCRSEYTFCKSFTPTGYLLKAMLIHSTDAVKRYSETAFNSKTSLSSYSLGSPPDSVQGYGALNLAGIPLSTSQRKKQDLYVRDKFSFAAGSQYVMQVSVSDNNKPLRVTLAWYDRPSTIGNAYNLLQSNLMLYVSHTSTGKYWYGNRATAASPDNVNPQEQVTISTPATGIYKVYLASQSGGFQVNGAVVVSCNGNVVSEPTYTTTTVSEDEEIMKSVMVERHTPTGSDMDISNSLRGHSDEKLQVEEDVGRVLSSSKDDVVSSSNAFSTVFSFAINNQLSPMTEVCTHSFSTTSTHEQLHSITLDLDAANHGGSAAFILAINLYAPSGETLQVGGYMNYKSSDRLWNRMWPVQWTGATSPVDGSSRWYSTRYLLDADLREVGDWMVCLEMMYDNWDTTDYSGHVTLRFIDTENINSKSKSKEAFNSGSMSDLALVLLVFFMALGAVLGGGLIVRKRVEIVDSINRIRARKIPGNLVVRRKKKPSAQNGSGDDVALNQVCTLYFWRCIIITQYVNRNLLHRIIRMNPPQPRSIRKMRLKRKSGQPRER